MKRLFQIISGFIILGLIGLFFSYNRVLPVSYGKIVLEGYYDGLMGTEELKLFDNGRFSYKDGWTKWNGEYEIYKDSIILDYYFPSNQPKIYLIENESINSYKIENGLKILVHDLNIIENKLATTKPNPH